ncbi:MAG: aspartyl-phosphate phosphatase Spo0E family protein [Thermotaleaceae bacterium]
MCNVQKILQLIEKRRSDLYLLIEKNESDLLNPDVIAASKELDLLLNQYALAAKNDPPALKKIV